MADGNTNNHLKQFGSHLRTIRLHKKLSLRKLAAKCNIEHSDITRYEKGEINLTFNTLIELSKGLDVALKDLMDFDMLV